MTITKYLLCIILFACSPVFGATQVIRYIDPDAAGAGTGVDWTNAYTSMANFNTTEATDITASDQYFTVYCRSSSGGDDTAAASFSGWTTDATRYVEIIGFDFPATGIWDETKYLIHNNDASASAINCGGADVHFINLQVKATCSGTNVRYAFDFGAGSDIKIDSCIVQGVGSGTGTMYGFANSNSGTTSNVYNTAIYGFVSDADFQFAGMQLTNGTHNLFNCTVYGCGRGVGHWSSVLTVTNCLVANNNDDFQTTGGGTLTISYCASDDGDGTNAQDAVSGDWDNEMTDANNGNFSLLENGNCVGNGTDNPGSGLYSDDIIGTARTSTWDIGAFEYSAAGVGTYDRGHGRGIIPGHGRGIMSNMEIKNETLDSIIGSWIDY